MKVKEIAAVLVGLLMLGAGPASAQLECDLFGCPNDGGEDTSGDDSGTDDGEDTSGEETVEEPGDEVGDLALPAAASDRAVSSSAKGIETANRARKDGGSFGASRAEK